MSKNKSKDLEITPCLNCEHTHVCKYKMEVENAVKHHMQMLSSNFPSFIKTGYYCEMRYRYGFGGL